MAVDATTDQNDYEFDFSQDGFARYFASRHYADVRHDSSTGAWYVFHKHAWVKDEGSLVRKLIRDDIEAAKPSLWRSAMTGQRDAMTFQKALGSAQVQAGIQKLIETDGTIGRSRVRWNPDPELLGAPNGVVDLRTGKIIDDDSGQQVIGHTAVDYEPDAKSEAWEETISKGLGGRDEARFFQELMGYVATGYTHEKIYVYLWGKRSTGKTTIMESIKFALGDYGQVASKNSFIARPRDDKGNDLKRLENARLALSTELIEGDVIDSARIKPLASGDLDVLRLLYAQFGEVPPRFKVVLVNNGLAEISENVDVDWEREITVRLGHVFPDGSIRTEMQKLEHQKAILAWVVRGAMRYLKAAGPKGQLRSLWGPNAEPGLPAFAIAWRDQHRDAVDVYMRFNAACLEAKEGSRVPVETVFEVFRKWSARQGEPITYAKEGSRKRQLGVWLSHHYAPSVSVNSVRVYEDVALAKEGKRLS